MLLLYCYHIALLLKQTRHEYTCVHFVFSKNNQCECECDDDDDDDDDFEIGYILTFKPFGVRATAAPKNHRSANKSKNLAHIIVINRARSVRENYVFISSHSNEIENSVFSAERAC